jgi:hypothetical protein
MAFIYENLLAVAEALLEMKGVGTAARRRAISTAYYAAFRRLASLCAASLTTDAEDFEIVLRSLSHKPLLKDLKSDKARALFATAGVKTEIGALFEALLNAREWADYSSAPAIGSDKAKGAANLTGAEAAKFVGDARAIIAALDGLDDAARQNLSILLTFSRR